MAYLGAQPNKTLTKTTSQSFNGTGSATTFTLNRAVNTEEELEVFVENVQQEPGSGKSYTASGTTLTFDEAPPSGTGNMYVIYRGQAEVTTRLEHDANQALSATTGTFSGAVSGTTGTFTGDLTVDTNTLFVDSTNNEVGIGTTSPTKKLSASIGLNDTDGLALEYSGENKGGILLNPIGGEVRMGALNSTGTYFTSIYANGSERLRVLSGGGLTFNGDTATANALDDYEEGDVANGFRVPTGMTASANVLKYTKIGRMVQITGYLTITGTSTASGNWKMFDLPFTSDGHATFQIGWNNVFSIIGSGDYVYFSTYSANSTSVFAYESPVSNAVTGGQWTAGTLKMQGTYITTA